MYDSRLNLSGVPLTQKHASCTYTHSPTQVNKTLCAFEKHVVNAAHFWLIISRLRLTKTRGHYDLAINIRPALYRKHYSLQNRQTHLFGIFENVNNNTLAYVANVTFRISPSVFNVFFCLFFFCGSTVML